MSATHKPPSGRLRNLTCRRVIASEHKKQDKCPEHGSSKKSSDSPKGKCFPNFFAVDPTLPFHYRVSTSSFTPVKWGKKAFQDKLTGPLTIFSEKLECTAKHVLLLDTFYPS
ncbi:hypothetical protein RUM43_003004 [Polyplax serrata]|uniref:Uncharacterized protein n=1 Tax=Polyplax serrata TaxID=468196 RepID=A0AAN8PN41_POLSC